ncbi:hypothetical protein GYB59_14425 [bacterium]|nr:hypothetical protein [bacterium]
MSKSKGIRSGRAYVELAANDDKLVAGLKRAQRRLQGFASMVTGIGAKMTAVAGVAAAPLAFAVKKATDMQEVMNKFNVVFGENSTEVKAWGDALGKQLGRSKKQMAEFLAESQDLLEPIGFNPGQALKMSKAMTQLAIDLASFNNESNDKDALDNLQSALTGSGEVMKKYGVILNQTAVNQRLLNDGIDPKKATEQQKVMARWKIILEGTTKAQGDALRSAGSLANQMKRFHAVVEDSAVAMGNALIPDVTKFVTLAADAVVAVGKLINGNQGLILTTAKVVAVVGAAGLALLATGAAAGSVAAILGLMASAVTLVTGAVGFLLTPLGAAVVVLGGLTTWLLRSSAATEWLGDMFTQLGNRFQPSIDAITTALKAGSIEAAAKVVWAELKLLWAQGADYLRKIWHNLTNWLVSHWEKTVGNLSEVIATVFYGPEVAAEVRRMTQQNLAGLNNFQSSPELAQARRELDAARKAASQPGTAGDASTGLGAGSAFAELMKGLQGLQTSGVPQLATNSGTFSALASRMYAGGDDGLSEDGKQITKKLDKIHRAIDDGGLTP